MVKLLWVWQEHVCFFCYHWHLSSQRIKGPKNLITVPSKCEVYPTQLQDITFSRFTDLFYTFYSIPNIYGKILNLCDGNSTTFKNAWRKNLGTDSFYGNLALFSGITIKTEVLIKICSLVWLTNHPVIVGYHS